MNRPKRMEVNYHHQQRLSFDGHLCTIRYIGQVKETKGVWLGVEWDDPSKGISTHPNAGSFVRPTRPHDTPLGFLEALQRKYAPKTTLGTVTDSIRGGQHASPKPIEIGGKLVEEVGFEKISQQLAKLTELRIVVLDGLCVAGVLNSGRGAKSDDWLRSLEETRQTCPKVVELDLSRNLLERWQDVEGICSTLTALRTLKLNGNRFNDLACRYRSPGQDGPSGGIFDRVKDLGLDETLLTWEKIGLIASVFPTLATLSVSSNNLTRLDNHRIPSTVTTLNLERNGFTSVSALLALAPLPNLQQLLLRHNSIATIYDPQDRTQSTTVKFPKSLFHIDLSYNAIQTWDFFDDLQDAFPGLTALRVAHNPLSDLEPTGDRGSQGTDEGYILTIARLGNLKSLNFSNITPQERANAEMYYLSCIAKQLAAESEEQEKTVLDKHHRYDELCEIYGAPTIIRTTPSTINPNSLEARLIRFTFYLLVTFADDTSMRKIVHEKRIPRGFDVYRLKGIVGKLFGQLPLQLRLIWETGEWDPVAPTEQRDWDSSDEEIEVDGGKHRGDWVKREIELKDGTREVGYWVEGREATVRVELR